MQPTRPDVAKLGCARKEARQPWAGRKRRPPRRTAVAGAGAHRCTHPLGSLRNGPSPSALDEQLVLKMKDKVEESRNNLGYAVPEDEFIPKNIRLWNVNYRPGLTSCVKHKFCYGSEPMESTEA